MSYTLFIDESGSISPNNGERYFCIGGYIVPKGDLSHKFKMKKIIDNVNKDREGNFNFFAKRDGLTEVKFANLSFKGKKYVLQELEKLNGTYISIIVDKKNCHSLINTDTNEYYNYLVCLLIKFVFETCRFSKTVDFEELKIIYDDRSMKVKARNGLQAYLIQKLKLERKESKQFSCNFNIKAADSKKNYGVMISDFVAGVCKDSYTRSDNRLMNILKIDYISKFPYSSFQSEKKIKKVIDKEQDDLYNIVNS